MRGSPRVPDRAGVTVRSSPCVRDRACVLLGPPHERVAGAGRSRAERDGAETDRTGPSLSRTALRSRTAESRTTSCGPDAAGQGEPCRGRAARSEVPPPRAVVSGTRTPAPAAGFRGDPNCPALQRLRTPHDRNDAPPGTTPRRALPEELVQSTANTCHLPHFSAKLSIPWTPGVSQGQCWTSPYLYVYMWMP